MPARWAIMEALLDKEATQRSNRGDCNGEFILTGQISSSQKFGQNAIWREKVVLWYFDVMTALNRQCNTSSVNSAGAAGHDDLADSLNPFNRASVHVSAALMDNYLGSLPAEGSRRYCSDRSSYQVLATTSLLLGIRLTQHDQANEARWRQQLRRDNEVNGSKLPRTRAFRENMDQGGGVSTSSPAITVLNAGTLLRISSAPKSISEQNVVRMARAMAGSRSFPRSKVVTALDFIHALRAPVTNVADVPIGTGIVPVVESTPHVSSSSNVFVTLGPADAEEAYQIVDLSLNDVTFLGCRPSIVACAAITLALLRSDEVNVDAASIRASVHDSIFGAADDPRVKMAVRKTELRLLRSTQSHNPRSVNLALRRVPTAHVIPCDDK